MTVCMLSVLLFEAVCVQLLLVVLQGVDRIRYREDNNIVTYSISLCRKEHQCSVNKVVKFQ